MKQRFCNYLIGDNRWLWNSLSWLIRCKDLLSHVFHKVSAAEALPHWNTPGLYWAQLARPEPMMSCWWRGQQCGDQQVSEMRNGGRVIVCSCRYSSHNGEKVKWQQFGECSFSLSMREDSVVLCRVFLPTDVGLKLQVASLKILKHGCRFSHCAAETVCSVVSHSAREICCFQFWDFKLVWHTS